MPSSVIPFGLISYCVMTFCVMPLSMVPFSIMPSCVMHFLLMPLSVMPITVMTFSLMPFWLDVFKHDAFLLDAFQCDDLQHDAFKGTFTRNSFWPQHSKILIRKRIVFGMVHLIYMATIFKFFQCSLLNGTLKYMSPCTYTYNSSSHMISSTLLWAVQKEKGRFLSTKAIVWDILCEPF